MDLKFYKLVSCYRIDPIITKGDWNESWEYIIEIYHDELSEKYFPRVYRYDSYRIAPSILKGRHNEELERFDATLVVLDHEFDDHELSDVSESAALNKVLTKLKRDFS